MEQTDTARNGALPLVKVAGTHREIGRQIGEAFPTQVHHSIENARHLLEEAYDILDLTWNGAQIQARKYLPFAQERYPQYVEELAGIAEGAGVSFDELAVVNVMEAVTTDALHLDKCTSLAVSDERTADGHVLVGHNEDWVPEDEPDVFLVHATPDDEPPFLAMTYGGLLPNIGFNAMGIAQCCDSVYPTDSRIGIPRVFVSRAVLAARTPAEAISQALAPQRAAGYNHLIVHESGEMYNVEVSARKFSLQYGMEGSLVHTNFYLAPEMRAIEDNPDELVGTQVRYYRAQRLLRQSTEHSVTTVKTILRDHVNYPNSICNHQSPDTDPLDRQKTINSLVIDLTGRVLHAACGNPCTSNYHSFYLEG